MITAPPRNTNSNRREIIVPSPPPPSRKKNRFWKTVGVLSVLAIVGGTIIGLYAKPVVKWVPVLLKVKSNPDFLFKSVGTPDGHVNVLLIGRDRNWKIGKVLDPTIGKYRSYPVEDKDTRPRSDTMIVASFDQVSKKVRLISFPRDTRVRYLDFKGRRHKAGKLNAVYALPNGDKLLSKVFKDEFGIRVDRTAEIKLDGFTKLIDQVGGLDINVEGALFDGKRKPMKYTDHWGGWSVDLKPGMQHLDGKQAHGYVRFRKDNEGDPGRVRRQQQVMRELAKKMMHASPWAMPGMVTELQKQFNTSMSDEELVAAAMFARGGGSSGAITPLTPYGVYASNGDIILNRPQNQKLLATIFGGTYNTKTFLPLSPETKGDDIGLRNNNNPAALPVLREAGLATAGSRHNARIEAPGLQ